MTTNHRKLLDFLGWKFIASHDSYINGQTQAVPDCWIHEEEMEKCWDDCPRPLDANLIRQCLDKMTDGQLLKYDEELEMKWNVIAWPSFVIYKHRTTLDQQAAAIVKAIENF
jgi:hypothetical protein